MFGLLLLYLFEFARDEIRDDFSRLRLRNEVGLSLRCLLPHLLAVFCAPDQVRGVGVGDFEVGRPRVLSVGADVVRP